VKGGCVVAGIGVVLALTAVDEDIGRKLDVAVPGGKVEPDRESLSFPTFSDVLEHFVKKSQVFPPRN